MQQQKLAGAALVKDGKRVNEKDHGVKSMAIQSPVDDRSKPTGQGTGMGLLLAYDILKAPGGELNIETG